MALGVDADLFKWERKSQLGSGCWKGTHLYLRWNPFIGAPTPFCRAELAGVWLGWVPRLRS